MAGRKTIKIADIEMDPVSILLFTLMLLALAVHPRAITVAYFALIAWSLTGTKQALQAITLSAVMRFLNPALFVKPPDITLLSYLLVLAAGVRPMMSVTGSSLRILIPLVAFTLIAAAGSLQNSNLVSVSLLKLTSFSFTFGITIIGFLSLKQDDVDAFKNWIFQLLFTLAFLSFLIFLIPGAGYKRTAEGFQGLLSHPQALGVVLAPFACYLLSQILTGLKKNVTIISLILGSVLVLIFFSGTRTGVLSIVLALTASLLVGFGFLNKTDGFNKKNVLITFMLIVFGMTAIYFSFSAIKSTTESFILKGKGTTVYESFQSSRGRKISSQIENFSDHPLLGNGFGVYATDQPMGRLSTIGGIPVSASAEKGFLPTAVLEETGILGTAAFVVFLGALLRHVISTQNFSALCIFFNSIFVNFGEMVFFSVNGLGSFFWILIGLSCVDGKTVTEASPEEAEHSPVPTKIRTQFHNITFASEAA